MAETTVGGLRAVELYFRVIRNISTGDPTFFQSLTRLNTPGLGVLQPESFREVTEVTTQCTDLFRLELLQGIEAVKKFTERELHFEWVTVYMPVRFLLEIRADRTLLEYCEKFEIPTGKLCFALSDRLLMERDGVAAERLRALRARGFHFMQTDFGADNCPLMRLADFPVDYVMLSPEVTQYIGRDERANGAVHSIIDFADDMGAKPIADGVSDSRQAETLYEFGCSYCAGPLAGSYMAEDQYGK